MVDMETQEDRIDRLEAALRAIALLGGNMPDDWLEERTGPNDAVHRGIMYTTARRMANEALRR